MILVADAGPLHYLVLIGHIEVLRALYNRAVIPQAVAVELQHRQTPVDVRTWITNLPKWCEIRPDPPYEPSLRGLGPGERSAIGLALSMQAERLLMDDRQGRAEAERRHLHVTGTIGVLAQAHLRYLLEFDAAVGRLRQTGFYVSVEHRCCSAPVVQRSMNELVVCLRTSDA